MKISVSALREMSEEGIDGDYSVQISCSTLKALLDVVCAARRWSPIPSGVDPHNVECMCRECDLRATLQPFVEQEPSK
jgi:hypothetical protein